MNIQTSSALYGNGPNFAFCAIFKNDLNIAHGGIDYSNVHRLTKNNISNCVQKCPSVMNNMQKADEAIIATIKSLCF